MALALLTGLYVAIVCTAQVTAGKIVEVPLIGRDAPAGTYLVGVALATVELAHLTAPTRRAGWSNAQAMIASGFVGSALLAGYTQFAVHSDSAFPQPAFDRALGSTWRIVAGSLAAFALSETLDNGLGAWMRGRFPDWARVLGTNAVSVPLDSVVFIAIAFGLGSLGFVPGQIAAKMMATVLIGLPLVYLIRRRLAPRPIGTA